MYSQPHVAKGLLLFVPTLDALSWVASWLHAGRRSLVSHAVYIGGFFSPPALVGAVCGVASERISLLRAVGCAGCAGADAELRRRVLRS